MSLVVVVEPTEQGFRVRSGEPLAMSVEAPSREEALEKFQTLWLERRQQGVELLALPIPVASLIGAGPIWPDDEITREWKAGIAEYRRMRDSETDPWELPESPSS